MAKGRIAHVMGQAGSGYNLPDFTNHRLGQLGVPGCELACHITAQRHAHTRHLQTVSKTVMHKDAARQREHLRFVLQATEGGGKNQTVVVALELGPVVMALTVLRLLAQSFVGD